MRISDWSSDVCSSDLAGDGVGTVDRRSAAGQDLDLLDRCRGDRVEVHRVGLAVVGPRVIGCEATVDQDQLVTRAQSAQVEEADRKSVAEGTRVTVVVELGGRTSIKTTKNKDSESEEKK